MSYKNADPSSPFGRALRMLQQGRSREEIEHALAANGLDAASVKVVLESLPEIREPEPIDDGGPTSPRTRARQREPDDEDAARGGSWLGFFAVSLFGLVTFAAAIAGSIYYVSQHSDLSVETVCVMCRFHVIAAELCTAPGCCLPCPRPLTGVLLAAPGVGAALAGIWHVLFRRRRIYWILAWLFVLGAPAYGVIFALSNVTMPGLKH